jgi:HAD superfamily hydrolase (TIGR01662 family)
MTHFVQPHYLIGSAANLRPETLSTFVPNTQAVIFDFDSTLADHGATEMPPDSIEMLERMGRAGVWCFIATNIYDEEARIRKQMARRLRDSQTRKPLVVETVVPEDVCQYGHEVREYRKPAPDMIGYILRTHGLKQRRTWLVGDQMRSDMRAAEDFEVARVLVAKRGTHDHPIVRLHRPLESLQRHLAGYSYFPEDLTRIDDWSVLETAERRANSASRLLT